MRRPPLAQDPDAPLTPAAVTELKLELDAAHARLRDLIAPCFAAVPKTKFMIRYRLLVAEKHVEIEQPEIVGSDAELGTARACILSALDNATWSAPLPDLDTPIEDQFNAEEL